MRHIPDIILNIFILISIVIMFLYMAWCLNNEPHKLNGAGIEKVFIKEGV